MRVRKVCILVLSSFEMYADLVESVSKRSVKDRLDGHRVNDSSLTRRLVTGKRQREDDKWQHDLYNHNEPRLSNSKAQRLDARDLRLKLQRRNTSQLGPRSGGGRDLRDMLSGSMHSQPSNSDLPSKPKVEAEPRRPAMKNVAEAPVAESKRVAAKKKAPQKGDSSVEAFLRSLGLEKYVIQFQAEEVDMTALEHMTDEDFKVMGVPMGPRKKILLALSART